MSQSTDPDNFFQTNHTLAETKRRARKSTNNYGRPIRLQSKILAVIADPINENAIYVAESTGTARNIVLDGDNPTPSAPYRGPTAPATCLAFSPPSASVSPSSSPGILFAGSWDKRIYSWNARTRAPQRTYANGHTDFVKALVTTALPPPASSSSPSGPTPIAVLISGGADARIVIWNMTTGEKLHVLKSRESSIGGGVLALAILPRFAPSSPPPLREGQKKKEEEEEEPITLFAATSLPPIRRYTLDTTGSANPEQHPRLTELAPETPISVHETSVYDLHFDGEGDLWTASADGDITCLACEKGWRVELRIRSGGWLRGVAVGGDGGWVVGVGRDEEVRVWEQATGELYHTYSGHYDEITGLVLLGQVAVTVSLDGTVRRWGLGARELEEARRKKKGEEEEREGGEDEGEGNVEGEVGITEDEERELRELMEEA